MYFYITSMSGVSAVILNGTSLNDAGNQRTIGDYTATYLYNASLGNTVYINVAGLVTTPTFSITAKLVVTRITPFVNVVNVTAEPVT